MKPNDITPDKDPIKLTNALSVESLQSAVCFQDAIKGIAEAQKSRFKPIGLNTFNAISIKTAWERLGFDPVGSQLRETLKEITASALSSYKPILSTLSDYHWKPPVSISEVFKGVTFTIISEERKRELLFAHQKWGEYGWTSIPMSDSTMFDKAPESRLYANKSALKVCTNAAVQQLITLTSEMRHCKKTDLFEASFDFDNRQYKSCSLVLCSLIDAKLVRLQKRSQLNGKRRDVGLPAVQYARKRAGAGVEEHMLLTLLFHANLFSCLEKVFEGGKDFKQQPLIINRNFLDHGMLTRKVTRTDCVQLFLLYYNILDLLEMIYQ